MIKDFRDKGEYYFFLKHVKKVKEPFFSKDYFDFGTAVDAFCDGGWEMFNQKVKIVSKRSGNRVPFGQVELTETTGENVKKCIDELQSQPLLRYYNTGAKQAILQLEDYRGLKIKGKLDNLNIDECFISDVKTTADIMKFKPSDYAQQLAMYGILAQAIYGKPFRLLLIVVDKYEDWTRSDLYEMSDATRATAVQELNETIDLIRDRKEYNTWRLPETREEIYRTALYKQMPNYEITAPKMF